MELSTLLIVLVIFGVISFFIELFTGFNPYVAYTVIGVVTVVGSLLYIMMPSLNNPGDIDMMMVSIERLTDWMINFLPGAIIGDVAGVMIAKITGGNR